MRHVGWQLAVDLWLPVECCPVLPSLIINKQYIRDNNTPAGSLLPLCLFNSKQFRYKQCCQYNVTTLHLFSDKLLPPKPACYYKSFYNAPATNTHHNGELIFAVGYFFMEVRAGMRVWGATSVWLYSTIVLRNKQKRFSFFFWCLGV